jgi:hypothetical protein
VVGCSLYEGIEFRQLPYIPILELVMDSPYQLLLRSTIFETIYLNDPLRYDDQNFIVKQMLLTTNETKNFQCFISRFSYYLFFKQQHPERLSTSPITTTTTIHNIMCTSSIHIKNHCHISPSVISFTIDIVENNQNQLLQQQ